MAICTSGASRPIRFCGSILPDYFWEHSRVADWSTAPEDVQVGPDGSVYVSSLFRGAIARFDATGNYLGDIVTGLTLPAQFVFTVGNTPTTVTHVYADGSSTSRYTITATATDEDGTYAAVGNGDLLISNYAGHNVLRYDPATGASLGAFIPAGSGGLAGTDGLLGLPDGTLLVSDYINNKILRYDAFTGTLLGTFASTPAVPVNGPTLMTIGPDGGLYVSCFANNTILRFDLTTGTYTVFVSAGSGGLSGPVGLAFGPDGNLYVGSYFNASCHSIQPGNRCLHRHLRGTQSSGGLTAPEQITFGPDGNLYIACRPTANAILRFDGATEARPMGVFASDSAALQRPHRRLVRGGRLSVCGRPGQQQHRAIRRKDRRPRSMSSASDTPGP